jgi:hypothetical protein
MAIVFSTLQHWSGRVMYPTCLCGRSKPLAITLFADRVRQLVCSRCQQQHRLRANSGFMHRSKRCSYSITLSAPASGVGGTARPSAFAVLRLITNSYLTDCTTGISAGFLPLRMRPRDLGTEPTVLSPSDSPRGLKEVGSFHHDGCWRHASFVSKTDIS